MQTSDKSGVINVPAVVAVGVPDISESQANKVRQAVAWEALSENTRAAYQKWIARLEAIGVAVESLTDESLAVRHWSDGGQSRQAVVSCNPQPHCSVGQVVSPAYPERCNGLDDYRQTAIIYQA